MALIKKGTMEMLDEIVDLYMACRWEMESRNIFQWFDSYPNRESVEWNLEHSGTYVLVDETDAITGVVVLNTFEGEEWQRLQWTETDNGCLVIHGLAIHPDHQGKGYGKQLLNFSEGLAQELGHDGIRLDAYSGNPTALGMYERNGYTCVGAIYFDMKPQPYNWYNCYEKIFV